MMLATGTYPRTAWMSTEGEFAMICAWCADKEVAEARATRAGLRLSHGICPECAAREMHVLFFASDTREKHQPTARRCA